MSFGLLFASLAIASLLVAQNPTATTVGAVRDPSGAAIVGVELDVRNTGTGISRKAVTNLRGEFTVPDLAPGPYEVTIAHAGFRTVRQTDIVLEMDQVARMDFKLAVGQAAQTVEVVEVSAPLINTDNGAKGQVMLSDEIVEMPLNGRNPFPNPTLVGNIASFGLFGYELHPPPQYIQSWNFTIERQIGFSSAIELSFVGSKGMHLGMQVELNQPEYRSTANPAGARPFPLFGNIQYFNMEGASTYHGVTATFRRRFVHGFFYTFNYTYSKSLDDASLFTLGLGHRAHVYRQLLLAIARPQYAFSRLAIRRHEPFEHGQSVHADQQLRQRARRNTHSARSPRQRDSAESRSESVVRRRRFPHRPQQRVSVRQRRPQYSRRPRHD